jgi:hypothetical protein
MVIREGEGGHDRYVMLSTQPRGILRSYVAPGGRYIMPRPRVGAHFGAGLQTEPLKLLVRF